MLSARFVIVVCFLTASLTLAFEEYDSDYVDARQIQKLILKSRTPEVLKKMSMDRYERADAAKAMSSFSWSDCGSSSDLAHIESLTLFPSPLRFPGNVTVAFQWKTTADLSSPIAMDLKVEKKIAFIWITVPCGMLPGTCHHADLCKDLSPLTCPPDYTSCHCPFKKGVYTLPSTTLTINTGGVPHGDYKVTAWMKQGGSEIGCVHMELAVG